MKMRENKLRKQYKGCRSVKKQIVVATPFLDLCKDIAENQKKGNQVETSKYLLRLFRRL